MKGSGETLPSLCYEGVTKLCGHHKHCEQLLQERPLGPIRRLNAAGRCCPLIRPSQIPTPERPGLRSQCRTVMRASDRSRSMFQLCDRVHEVCDLRVSKAAGIRPRPRQDTAPTGHEPGRPRPRHDTTPAGHGPCDRFQDVPLTTSPCAAAPDTKPMRPSSGARPARGLLGPAARSPGRGAPGDRGSSPACTHCADASLWRGRRVAHPRALPVALRVASTRGQRASSRTRLGFARRRA